MGEGIPISALPTAAPPTTADYIPCVRGGVTKKATIASIIALANLPTFPAGAVVGTSDAQALTNKTIAGASNTLSVRIANDVTGLGANVDTFLGTPSGANLASALTSALPASKGGTGLTAFPTVTRGTFASRPAAGVAGSMYICTDGPVSFFDDGAAWQPIKIFGGMTSPALVSTFTAINAGGRAITATDVKGTLSMVMTNGIGADDFRILKKAVTPLTTYSLIVHMYPTLVNTNYSGAGVCFRESSSGKTSHFGVIMSGGTVNIIWRNETANNTGASPTFTTGTDIVGLTADTGFVDFNLSQNGIWLKISDDGVNRTASYCVHDDLDWIQFGSVGRTVTFTADEVGLWVGNANNTGTAASAKAVFDSVSLAA